MNPYVIIGFLIALTMAGVSGYVKGHHDAVQDCQIAKDKLVQSSQALKDVEAKKANTESVKLEGEDAKAKVVYRTITQVVDRVVERPVYRTACFDPDGLRAANEALAGKTADTGEPDGSVSESGSTR